MNLKPLCLGTGALMLTACASNINPSNGEGRDPLENFNRAMWKINYEVIDPHIFKPVAKGWRDYVPAPIKRSLVNIANNLDEPASFVNRLIEGDGQKAMRHFTRFWINSTFGLAGLIDWASQIKELKLENGNREFGDTLGHYGVPAGSYIMAPGYGPITPRQAVGKVVDSVYPMLSMLATPWMLTKFFVQSIDTRAQFINQEALLTNSADPYISFREAYFQNLRFKVKDGDVSDIQEQLSQEELDQID
ncbi:hypothetical protein A6046_02085 [[Haemophilus] ducreyi]|uniref:VacJ lipoprotein n=2 Tax=Haemophilus ducreyi TaxID=730 RepID=Q7VN89_HAEDU|nr:MlaA family lipoprotein [[Haemophilus] ducreyi]AAP95597.1 VacJ lipoprotein [[Haemophilus] ducreyi 35000HP]AKO30673.1 hypothetical protein RY60_02645 [[Haemophilus] ducreyi]AKO32110.1 hypothetical protein RZ57_02650 [[Haemophilus] ducreyi]AKO33566.1 hypothetical protein RZ58_02655 [[Haemophilus] ducreyi]AKO35011.1 hypothetical protein RZ59_02630 [[Haemophilus] ducreyi]